MTAALIVDVMALTVAATVSAQPISAALSAPPFAALSACNCVALNVLAFAARTFALLNSWIRSSSDLDHCNGSHSRESLRPNLVIALRASYIVLPGRWPEQSQRRRVVKTLNKFQPFEIQPLNNDVMSNLSIEELEERLELQILHMTEAQACYNCSGYCDDCQVYCECHCWACANGPCGCEFFDCTTECGADCSTLCSDCYQLCATEIREQI